MAESTQTPQEPPRETIEIAVGPNTTGHDDQTALAQGGKTPPDPAAAVVETFLNPSEE